MLDWSTAMSFDFGMKKIGVAIGQAITKSASPISQISAINGDPNWQELDKLIREWHPDVLVVGLPLNIDNTWQPITTHAKNFLKTLEDKYQLPTFYSDERLTTKSAKEEIFAKFGYKGLKKYSVDSIAAVLILEQWMQEQNFSN
ncbi:MAG: Holliday junction resolvase RuvX [Legionellales bacterium]|nr:Holliday junction resolvase RuvX [Legionellales bacterium]